MYGHFKKTGALLLLSSFVLLSCAGSRMKISDIRSMPGKYNEHKVKVAGKVTQTFAIPFLGQSLVLIDDGTGKIWVKPKGRVPFEGEEIKVEGKLKVGLTIANKNIGFIVIEGNEEK